jgi:TolB protein
VDFAVVCYPTGIDLRTITTGLDLDPDGYLVQVEGRSPQGVTPNGSFRLSRLAAGSYTLVLQGIGENCQSETEISQVVDVVSRQITPVEFRLSCVATAGMLELTVVTSGVDPDLTGYALTLDQAPFGADLPGTSPVLMYGRIPPGSHELTLGEVASNCSVQQGNSRSFEVTAGTLTRDTARVEFRVDCLRTDRLALTLSSGIVVAHADGTELVDVAAPAFNPSWSPDGQRLVFAVCYFYYFSCYSQGLAMARADGSQYQPLTTAADQNPSWSPDGSTIVYDRDGALRLQRLDGSASTVLAVPVSYASHPVWSPDGNTIAFTCAAAGNLDICRVNRDGTGFTRLTTDGAFDQHPAWSADGTRIAFDTGRFGAGVSIAVMNADGSGVALVRVGQLPSWTPDGRIVFVTASGQVAFTSVDGSGFVELPVTSESAPAWRP